MRAGTQQRRSSGTRPCASAGQRRDLRLWAAALSSQHRFPCPALLASPCSLLGSATTRRPARVLQHHEVPALLLPVPMSSRRPLGRIPHSERLCPAQLSPVLALTEQSTAMPATSRSFVLSSAFPYGHWCSPASAPPAGLSCSFLGSHPWEPACSTAVSISVLRAMQNTRRKTGVVRERLN